MKPFVVDEYKEKGFFTQSLFYGITFRIGKEGFIIFSRLRTKQLAEEFCARLNDLILDYLKSIGIKEMPFKSEEEEITKADRIQKIKEEWAELDWLSYKFNKIETLEKAIETYCKEE